MADKYTASRYFIVAITALLLLLGLVQTLRSIPSPSQRGASSRNSRLKHKPAPKDKYTTPLNATYEIQNELQSAVRIKKVSAVVGESNYLYEAALKTHERHNELHGYEMQVLRRRVVASYWSKPSFVMSVLIEELAKPKEERNDWLVWVDADTVVLNAQVPLEMFLPPEDEGDIHLIGSHDINGFNAGVFFLRVNPWSVNFLVEVMAVPLADNRQEQALAKDASSVESILDTAQHGGFAVYQPRRWFNSLYSNGSFEGEVGDLLVHFPDVSGDKWLAMDTWLGNVTAESEHWERAVDSLSLKSDIDKYWARIREAHALLRLARKTANRKYDKTKMHDLGLEDAARQLLDVVTHRSDSEVFMKDAIHEMRKAFRGRQME